MDLGIAHVGLAASDIQRLKAILGIAIASGSLRCRWCMTSPTDAHLIIVSGDSTDGAEVLANPESYSGKTIAVLAGESDDYPRSRARLPWPIRLEDVLSLLTNTEKIIARVAEKLPRNPVALDTGNHLVQLATLLRDAESPSSNAAWKIKGFKKSDLYVLPKDGAFYFNDSLESLRNIDPNIRLEFAPIAIESLSQMGSKKPIIMLQWLVGLLAGPNGLFPWLKEGCVFRLRRFPDFQLLVHSPQHRRLAAVLARPRRSVSLIAKLTGTELATVNGFLNAMSLTGQLIVSEATDQNAGTAIPNTNSRAGLFRSLRKALGIPS